MTFTKCANIFQNLKVLIYKGFNISAYRAFLLYRRYFGHFSEENFFMNFHRIPLAQIQIHLRKIQKLKHAVVFTNRYELWKYTVELLKRSRKNLEVLNGPRIDNSFNGGGSTRVWRF